MVKTPFKSYLDYLTFGLVRRYLNFQIGIYEKHSIERVVPTFSPKRNRGGDYGGR